MNHVLNNTAAYKCDNCGGPVMIETNPLKIKSMKVINNNWSEAAVIWEELVPLLNVANDIMHKFLVKEMKVKSIHDIMSQFKDVKNPIELHDRLFYFFGDGACDGYKDTMDTDYDDGVNDIKDDTEEKHKVLDSIVEQLTGKCATDDNIVIIDEENIKDGNSNCIPTKGSLKTAEIRDNDDNIVNDNVYKLFMDIMTSEFWERHTDSKIVRLMAAMKLDKREKGDVKKLQSHKGLIGRWFESEQKKVEKESSCCIKRGSIVTMSHDDCDSVTDSDNSEETQIPEDKYIVMCVFKEHGKKWHPSPKDDDPCWPLDEEEANKYRLLIRKISVTVAKNGTKVVQMKSGNIVPAKIVYVHQVQELLFHVEY